MRFTFIASISPLQRAALAVGVAGLAVGGCGANPTLIAPTAMPEAFAPSPSPAPTDVASGSAAPTEPGTAQPAPAALLTPARDLRLPDGFHAFLFVAGLTDPTALTFGPDGRLYVAQADGQIYSFGDQGGASAGERLVARTGGTTLGIAFRPGTRDLYVSSTGVVSVLRGSADGSFGLPTRIVQGLPNGRHQNDEIAFAPGGDQFFLGVGSTCDACAEQDPRSASILRISADGKSQQVFAHGLRNPFGLAVEPGSGQLFATDNGRDSPASGVPDELNVIEQDRNYGWPDCWGAGGGSHCEGTVPPIAQLEEHGSADGFVFYSAASFPAEYRGNAFIALWGDNAGSGGVGRRVDRVVLKNTGGGWQAAVSTFAAGFDHPLDLAVSPRDGSLFVADFGNGRIYRIVWGAS